MGPHLLTVAPWPSAQVEPDDSLATLPTLTASHTSAMSSGRIPCLGGSRTRVLGRGTVVHAKSPTKGVTLKVHRPESALDSLLDDEDTEELYIKNVHPVLEISLADNDGWM